MHLQRQIIILASVSATGVLSDFLGPTYPSPKDLKSNTSHVSSAWSNVTSTIQALSSKPGTNSGGPSRLKNLTFSIGMFSVHDKSAECLQFHHTAAQVANSSTGVTKVDGDSIYRTASITKVITAFAGMLEFSDEDWNRPITHFIPALAEHAQNSSAKPDSVNTIQWDKVTLAALGAHMAGTPRDVIPADPRDFFYVPITQDPVRDFGLPPLNPTDLTAFPPCAAEAVLIGNETCTNNDYAKGAMARPPMFLPWTSPSYTDFGYMLLGIALANVTGKSIDDVYSERIFGPLGMSSSSSLPPDQSQWKYRVIPGDIVNAALTPQSYLPFTRSSGGVSSTTNDLAKLGTAILNSTLLPSDQTRKWMKQISHTASLENLVGRPWEIYRYTHPGSGIVTDIYTKAGDAGAYTTNLILIPDFDAGFSILAASSLPGRTATVALLADLVTEQILPALMAQAEAEAEPNFAGTYTSSIPGLNTTLTLALNQTAGAKPGLVITSFISNGTNVLLTEALGGPSPVRLLPSIPESGTGQIAFRTSPYKEPGGGPFSRQLTVDSDWLFGDLGTYGGLPTGLFVFDLDREGKATAVRPAAWRIKLDRKP
ncbi:hypothetical protein G7Y79_00056g090280 [Physcia stellaris]|nr:hypothetical protein G7Y79_00056g090280 [Physcia stellaris]